MYHLLQEFKGMCFYHTVFYVFRVVLKTRNFYFSLPLGHSCKLVSLMGATTMVAARWSGNENRKQMTEP